MKFSKYNTFQTVGSKTLGFNTYTKKFTLLDPFLHELITAATYSQPEELKEVHSELYEMLILNGFIISDDVDELKLVADKLDRTIYHRKEYRLIINPTMNCNFKCWYCYETHIKDSKMDDPNILKVSKFVEKILLDNIDFLQISFFGGEPMLYYKKVIVPILEHAKDHAKLAGVQIGADFTTNGYLIEESMIESFKKLSISNFQITLDGHKQLHDNIRFVSKTKGSYDKIIENIILLAKNQIEVNVRINYTKENIFSIDDILEDLSQLDYATKQFITISLQKVWQESETDFDLDIYSVIENLKRRINELQLKNISPASIDAIAYTCYADKVNHATINYNGDVFKCTARDFESKNRVGKLSDDGNINWNEDHTKRYDLRLKNKPCLECSILPICGGGCSQLALENEGKDYCVNDFDEAKKMNVVRDMFMSSFYV